MVEIAKKYLERIGMINTQYVVAKHTDTEHPHMHVIANRVNNDGKSVAEGWIGLQLPKKAPAQELTKEYGLRGHVKEGIWP